ncbi:g831 [Coccomyxa viridis]|uniref:G831 protein n=1 Tax=Coccomyxa viridis TaxID=1274662 RepID=A0ABP1FGM8_9CHLO
MDGFFKKAAAQINAEAEKLATTADAKIGHGAGDQVKKYGAEAAEKISNMNAQQEKKEGDSDLTKLQKEGGVPQTDIPNVTTGNKAAVPESANPVTMGTVTKIPGNKPDIATNNPVADNSGGSAKPEEAK